MVNHIVKGMLQQFVYHNFTTECDIRINIAFKIFTLEKLFDKLFLIDMSRHVSVWNHLMKINQSDSFVLACRLQITNLCIMLLINVYEYYNWFS